MIDELGTIIDLPGDRLRLEWAEILRRDPCAYCGGPGGTVDHIVPVLRKTKHYRNGKGETATTTNGTGSCADCNGSKKSLKLIEFLLDPEGAHKAQAAERRAFHIREQLKRKIFTDEQLERLKERLT